VELAEQKLPDGLFGVCVQRRGRWIVVDARLGPEERRLTLLHEGVHLVRHAGNGLYLALHDAS
jgi:Zn-dependent peptidase ImmA (M78 family)